VDSSGNVYVTGYTYGGLDGNTNMGNADIFLVKWKGDVGSNANYYLQWIWEGIIFGPAKTVETGCAWDLTSRDRPGN